jgi:hypothetical protein
MLRPLRNWIWAAVVVVIALNIYFVRELFAAELLFGLLIGSLLLVGFVFYLIQQVGQLSLTWARPLADGLAQGARRGWSFVEEISRKPFRHPRSESAQ